MSYQHLNLEERYYIELSLNKEMSASEIGAALGRSQSTISREISVIQEKEGIAINRHIIRQEVVMRARIKPLR